MKHFLILLTDYGEIQRLNARFHSMKVSHHSVGKLNIQDVLATTDEKNTQEIISVCCSHFHEPVDKKFFSSDCSDTAN